MRLRGSAAPEVEFGLAAGLEGRQRLTGGMIPEEQLAASFIIVAGIELAKECGGSEPAAAEIEAEIHETVVLALGERNFDEMLDGAAGSGNVGDEKLLGLGPGDAVREGLAGAKLVAIANSGPACDIVVSGGAESFGSFEEVESGIAEAHEFLQGSGFASPQRSAEWVKIRAFWSIFGSCQAIWEPNWGDFAVNLRLMAGVVYGSARLSTLPKRGGG